MFSKDREFHKTFWPFFLTLTIQNVIVIGVNLTDNVMLGRYSESALSGAATINQIQVVMQMIIGGAVDGAVVLASQYWGQNRTQPIKRVCAAALYAAVAVAFIFFAFTSIFPVLAVRIFTNDEAITIEALRYLSYVRFTYPLIAVSSALLALLRSVESVRIALVTSSVAFVLNIPLNYLLIYGGFGIPEMGSAGAALATLICRVIETAIIVCYVLLFEKKIKVRLKELFRLERVMTFDYLKVSGPLLIVGLQYGLNLAAHMIILGHLTSEAIAANSISVNLVSMLKIIAVASATASGVIIGKTVGRGDVAKAKEYARTLQIIFIGIGLASCAAILLLRGPILSLYSITDETRKMAWDFLFILSLTNIGTAYQMPTATGIVRGGGDTRFVMVNDMVSIWVIVIPLSIIAAFVLHWPPTLVLICLYSDQVFKCVPAAIKVNRFRWMKNLTRA